MNPIRIVVCGGCGKMGSRVIDLAARDKRFAIAAAVETAGHPSVGKSILDGRVPVLAKIQDAARNADAVIDFTQPEATAGHAEACSALRKPLVIGTTGLTDRQAGAIRSASQNIPVVLAANFSTGVNLLYDLAARAAKALPSYNIEIVEIHHNMKKDAPSGTALKLAEILAANSGRDIARDGVYGRQGNTGPRKPGEIGIHSVRAGDIVGEHSIIFAGPGERLELVHRASSRDCFAAGALAAAAWLLPAGKPRRAGLYSMQDVLGLAGAGSK